MKITLSMMQQYYDCMMNNKGEMPKQGMSSGMMSDGEPANGNNMIQMMIGQIMEHQNAMQNTNK